ncbi:MAG: hypothetical protein LQ337_001596 [Flavoplaca oasis]|nr:MAG: hypothetical protein LQ337_001596 [Flavoplaca oasis]
MPSQKAKDIIEKTQEAQARPLTKAAREADKYAFKSTNIQKQTCKEKAGMQQRQANQDAFRQRHGNEKTAFYVSKARKRMLDRELAQADKRKARLGERRRG